MRNFLRHPFSGLRLRLLLLVALAAAPAVALALYTGREARQRQAANWRAEALRIVQLTTREEDELIGGTRQLLRAVAESSDLSSRQWRSSSRKFLGRLLQDDARYANLGVIKTNGELLVSALPFTEPVNLADRPYFQRALYTHALSIGDYQIGRVSGKRAINFGYPVLDSADRVQAVVFAALDLDWLNRSQYALKLHLPEGTTWTKVDLNGTILVRQPAPEHWIGQPLPEPALVKTFLEKKNGELEAVNAQGAASVYVFASTRSPLVAGDLITILSIPKKLLFAEADRLAARSLMLVGLVAGLTLVLGWIGSSLLVLRQVRALVRSTARLARGDFSARTGLVPNGDELGQLTRTFDQMAQTLQQRELERTAAEEKLQHYSHRLQLLSHGLVEAQETERRRISRELHDEIGQALTVAQIHLQTLLHEPGLPAQTARLGESLQVVERVLAQVQDISLNLRPSMLDDLGLESTLRWYTQRQTALTGIKSSLQVEALEHRLSPVVETECFRVAQEALTNIARHARAQTVTVDLRAAEGRLHLRVRDDGAGFEVGALREQAVQGASLGLLSMEERAVLAGGGIEINSAPGQGTEVHAWFPLTWQTAPGLPDP